jgi:hypothetical protein
MLEQNIWGEFHFLQCKQREQGVRERFEGRMRQCVQIKDEVIVDATEICYCCLEWGGIADQRNMASFFSHYVVDFCHLKSFKIVDLPCFFGHSWPAISFVQGLL